MLISYLARRGNGPGASTAHIQDIHLNRSFIDIGVIAFQKKRAAILKFILQINSRTFAGFSKPYRVIMSPLRDLYIIQYFSGVKSHSIFGNN